MSARPPVQNTGPLTLGGAAKVAVREGYLMGLSFLFRQRVPKLLPTYSANFHNRQLPLVVMVPGYIERPGCFAALYEELVFSGMRVALYTPRYVLASVRDMSADFGQFLDHLVAKPECENSPIYLLGHSMGGLIVRKAMSTRWDSHAQVQHLFTLASPNNGTKMAHLGIGDCVVDMMPGSEFLTELNGEDRHQRHRMSSIVVTPDALILGPEFAQLPGAQHHHIDASGHMAVLDDPRLAWILKRQCQIDNPHQLLGI
ncbi:MAG TPA: alpha/beta hydrolase [Limnobacter sp.]|uniref:lipase family alpha/beta hydrolase n=1 Tax=Limnobacter sp. TaxID=2003368 RepID=UPI002ED8A4A1